MASSLSWQSVLSADLLWLPTWVLHVASMKCDRWVLRESAPSAQRGRKQNQPFFMRSGIKKPLIVASLYSANHRSPVATSDGSGKRENGKQLHLLL